ncbi:MAG TPA: FxLYD domain-containing protein [Anaerolineae bacterium]|nr:FxLYD domain-containing protein [Anaerolineae bacterium]
MKRLALVPLCLVVVLVLVACSGGGSQPTTGSQPMSTAVSEKEKRITIKEVEGREWKQVETDSSLQVVSAKLFFTGIGEIAYVIGELENTGDAPVTDVTITIKSYGADGTLLDDRDGSAPFDVVAAGQKVPFKTQSDLRDVTRFELEVHSKVAEGENVLLDVTNPAMSEPKVGSSWITGDAKNTTGAAIKGFRVIAVLRDADGAVVELGVSDVSTPLEAGATASFKYSVSDRNATAFEVFAQPTP